MSELEQIEICIAEGIESLKNLQQIKKIDGVPAITFWGKIKDVLTFYITETQAGIIQCRNVVGFNLGAIEYILNHYLEVQTHVDNILIGIKGNNFKN